MSLTKSQEWYQKNRDRLREYKREYHRRKKEEDPQYMEKRRESDRRYHAERGGKKVRDAYNKKYREEGHFTARRHARRKLLIEMLGGKCVRCGATERLHFDHINPLEKSFDIGRSLDNSMYKLEPELAKCQLLCPKCHLDKTFKEDFGAIMEKKRRNK